MGFAFDKGSVWELPRVARCQKGKRLVAGGPRKDAFVLFTLGLLPRVPVHRYLHSRPPPPRTGMRESVLIWYLVDAGSDGFNIKKGQTNITALRRVLHDNSSPTY